MLKDYIRIYVKSVYTLYLIYELGVAANVYKNISEFFSIPWDYNLVAKSCRITGELLKGPVTANIF